MHIQAQTQASEKKKHKKKHKKQQNNIPFSLMVDAW